MKNYYSILGVAVNASDREIKKAYRKAALHWHPDRNPSPEAHGQFLEIGEAYEILRDLAKRKVYDDLFNTDCASGKHKESETGGDFSRQENQRRDLENWIKEARNQARSIIRNSDDYLINGFHFIDKYGLFILIASIIFFFIYISSAKK